VVLEDIGESNVGTQEDSVACWCLFVDESKALLELTLAHLFNFPHVDATIRCVVVPLQNLLFANTRS
jgi:hypothetical protein